MSDLNIPAIGYEEIAVDTETFDAVVKFQRSRSTMSISFKGFSNGCIETFSLYRFVDEDTDRKDLFLHATHHGYEEIISLDIFETTKKEPYKIGVKTSGVYSISILPVGDLERYQISAAIQHILFSMALLDPKLKDNDGQKEVLELAFGYMKMLDEEYK